MAAAATDIAIDVEDEEAEGGQEEKCSSRSHSVLSMYSDWVLSLRRPGCSRRLMDLSEAGFPGGELREEPWLSACGLMPCGSLTVSGIMGLRRCNRCLREELEEEELREALLEIEEVDVAGLRFGRETRPPGTLKRWARSAGLGGQTGLCLLRGVPHPPVETEKRA